MIGKLLIANRGEIACRIIATCRRMGIATVAVYSDADIQARHVKMADDARRIGPAPVGESYLCGERIIAAALTSGAEAIHPGYGFLSENADFAEAVVAAGLIFVGPTARAIRTMGQKDAAKTLMAQAGVPVLPGYHGSAQDPAFLARQADDIGYPLMIKACSGGGGKGLRRVADRRDFHDALAAAQREAEASFGDPSCLIEACVAHPRHIEFQVFGDAHGNVIHLFERDCSLQRRHQKVIEEAPAPGMTEEMRKAMGQAAIAAARAVDYTGAGTVEFIVDGSQPLRPDGFWFMEMNTRLQVEHPVSEAITGLDFVEWQLRIAAGAQLPLDQAALRINGWAVEARIYAEDAGREFLPATGRLDHLAFPAASEFSCADVRVDSGVGPGDEISPFYDPMIAKLIVHGPDRASALSRLRRALAECRVLGVSSNLGVLVALASEPEVAAGAVDTGLIDRHRARLCAPAAPSLIHQGLAALAAAGLLEPAQPSDPWAALTGWRHWGTATFPVELAQDGTGLRVYITPLGGDLYEIAEGPEGDFPESDEAAPVTTRLQVVVEAVETAGTYGTKLCRLRTTGRSLRCDLCLTAERISVFCDGAAHVFDRVDPLVVGPVGTDVEDGGDRVTAPIPGRIIALLAQVGAAVAKGDALLVLEAMKMEHRLQAPRDGAIAALHVRVGDQVAEGAVLMTLEPVDD